MGLDSEVHVLSQAWLASLGKPSLGGLLGERAVSPWGLIRHVSALLQWKASEKERGGQLHEVRGWLWLQESWHHHQFAYFETSI